MLKHVKRMEEKLTAWPAVEEESAEEVEERERIDWKRMNDLKETHVDLNTLCDAILGEDVCFDIVGLFSSSTKVFDSQHVLSLRQHRIMWSNQCTFLWDRAFAYHLFFLSSLYLLHLSPLSLVMSCSFLYISQHAYLSNFHFAFSHFRYMFRKI